MLQFTVGFVITPRHTKNIRAFFVPVFELIKTTRAKARHKKNAHYESTQHLCKMPARSQATLTTQELQFYS
jgi:hypothetical protein